MLAWFVPAFNNLVLLLIAVLRRLFPRIAVARLARREAAASGTSAACP
jgi:hypothetical protein